MPKGLFTEKRVWFRFGSVTECNGKLLIHLPGPPFEMKMMAQNQMMPFLEEKFGNQGVIRSAELPVKGLSEAEIETGSAIY